MRLTATLVVPATPAVPTLRHIPPCSSICRPRIGSKSLPPSEFQPPSIFDCRRSRQWDSNGLHGRTATFRELIKKDCRRRAR